MVSPGGANSNYDPGTMLFFARWALTASAIALLILLPLSGWIRLDATTTGFSVVASRGSLYLKKRGAIHGFLAGQLSPGGLFEDPNTYIWDPGFHGHIIPEDYYWRGDPNGQAASWINRYDFELRPILRIGRAGFRFRLPLWQPTLAAIVLSAALWYIHARRPPAGHCRKCRYNLHGLTSAVCPECGTPVPKQNAPPA